MIDVWLAGEDVIDGLMRCIEIGKLSALLVVDQMSGDKFPDPTVPDLERRIVADFS